MNVPEIILQQLGGNRFAAVTGSKNFTAVDEFTLRMKLAKNISGANTLEITLDTDDTYSMRFMKQSAPHLRLNQSNNTASFSKEKNKEISSFRGVYCDMLQDIFSQVTGFDLSLCRVQWGN